MANSYLTHTGTAGGIQKFTYVCWVKRANDGIE